MIVSVLIAAVSVTAKAAALSQVGPCAHPECPQITITVCHNPMTGNSSAVLRDLSTGGVKFAGLGMGSTKTLHMEGAAFFPCGTLTWDVVDELLGHMGNLP